MIKNNSAFSVKKAEDGSLIILLTGEIDHHSAVGVRRELDDYFFENRPENVILDLSQISFMDSSGLGLIMGRYSLLRDLGGKLSVRNPSARVEKILNLAGLERIIKIEKSEEEK